MNASLLAGLTLAFFIPLVAADLEMGKDVAVLKIEARNAPTLPLGISANAQVGDRVWVMAQWVVRDPEISTVHAWTELKGPFFVFVDRGSTNGSFIDAHPGLLPGD